MLCRHFNSTESSIRPRDKFFRSGPPEMQLHCTPQRRVDLSTISCGHAAAVAAKTYCRYVISSKPCPADKLIAAPIPQFHPDMLDGTACNVSGAKNPVVSEAGRLVNKSSRKVPLGAKQVLLSVTNHVCKRRSEAAITQTWSGHIFSRGRDNADLTLRPR